VTFDKKRGNAEVPMSIEIIQHRRAGKRG